MRFSRVLVVLIVIAALRAIATPFFSDHANPGPDGYDYLRVAHDFVKHPFPWDQALSQWAWAPGWPAFLAVLFRLFGDSWFVIRAANALLWLVSILCTYYLIDGVLGAEVALLATTLVAWDNLINFVKFANYEVFLFFLTTFFLLAVLRAITQDRPLWLMAAAVAGGLSCLVQGKCVAVVAVIGVVAFGILARSRSFKGAVALAVPPLILFWLVVLPYSLYSWKHTGRFTFVAAVGPMNLLIGNGPHATGLWTWTPDPIAQPIAQAAPADQMKAAISIVLPHILSQPVRFLTEMLPRKIWYFWGLDTWRHTFFLILMCLGMVLHTRALGFRTTAFLLWVPVVLTFLIHLVYYGFERYRYPILPGIHAYTAVALLALFRPSQYDFWGTALLALVPICVVVGLSWRALRPAVIWGWTGPDGGSQTINIWTAGDKPLALSWQEGKGPEHPCAPTIRRVQDNYYATLPFVPAKGTRLTFTVRAEDHHIMYQWTQDF